MKSCDWEVLSTIITNLSYSQISYMCGIRNCLRELEYSEETIYLPDSRGDISLLNLLRRMGVSFHLLNLDEMIKSGNFENIILLAPLAIVENISQINEEYSQISLVYSAFRIEKIESNSIKLYINTRLLKARFSITIEEFEKMNRINSKPLGKTCYLVSIDNSDTYSISISQMNDILKESLKNFNSDIETMHEGMKCVHGKTFYLKFKDIINSQEFWHSSKNAYMKRFLFISAMNAGARCFYRKDFLDAITEYELIEKKSNLYLNFEKISTLWRKLNRILRKIQVKDTEELKKKYKYQIIELIDSIQELELYSVKMLKNNFL